MLIGFFIEPEKKLKKIILGYKKITKKNYGDQIYLAHPPHLTLFTIRLKKKLLKNKIIQISKFIKNYKRIKINITKVNFFYNDPQTKGNTMFLSLKKNISLCIFQIEMIKFLNEIIGSSNIIKKKKFSGLMKKNYKKYGYPFVGKNWIPHFTISSISKKNDLKKIKFNLKRKIQLANSVKKISIWLINKDQHKKLHTINLK